MFCDFVDFHVKIDSMVCAHFLNVIWNDFKYFGGFVSFDFEILKKFLQATHPA